ncbi:monocarboxylate transporter 13 [Lingula anatina]|uniref:Monocarboxylate transporter 13 n=1 Tax=Lingula anatina TaxID=7574 RepID=A0A1S3IRR7_LINAN|nr:monocarboxylate transporter 13 [Lingula anatina]XP_013400775.1 monocarboxylate transporter 13 [Lingula anatina]XP_013400783.1 monocarboxylate transporter 13 [Lingula anatina]|eukprot:XP_013400768.1 monocarboxylate transporter 13 [Lingula anatina]
MAYHLNGSHYQTSLHQQDHISEENHRHAGAILLQNMSHPEEQTTENENHENDLKTNVSINEYVVTNVNGNNELEKECVIPDINGGHDVSDVSDICKEHVSNGADVVDASPNTVLESLQDGCADGGLINNTNNDAKTDYSIIIHGSNVNSKLAAQESASIIGSVPNSLSQNLLIVGNGSCDNDQIPKTKSLASKHNPLSATMSASDEMSHVTENGHVHSVSTKLANENSASVDGDSIDPFYINNGISLIGYDNKGFDVKDDEVCANGKVNTSDVVVSGHTSKRDRKLSERSVGGESSYSGTQRRLSLASWSPVVSLTESRQPSVAESAGVQTDRCIDWLVVLASFFIHFIVDGILFSFGVLYVTLLNEFEESKSATSWVGSIQNAGSWIMGPIASALSDKIGHRAAGIAGSVLAATGFGVSSLAPNLSILYLTYGVMTGLGFGLMYFPSIVSVQDHFEKRKSLAMGIAVCGSGVGTFSMAPFTEFLIKTISWRYTLLVLAGLSLSGIGFCMLFLPPKPKQNEEILTEQTLTRCDTVAMFFKNVIDISLLRELYGVIWLACTFTVQVGFLVPYTYIPDSARAKGVEANNAAFLVSIVGIANTVARIVMGVFADFKCINRGYMFGTSVMIAGIMVSILPFMKEYGVIATVCTFYGLTLGTFVSLAPVVLRDLVGIEKLGPSFGLTMLAIGLGSLLLSAGGSLYDLTGSYDVTFYITGSLLFVAGGALLLLPWIRDLQGRCCHHGSANITTETEL